MTVKNNAYLNSFCALETWKFPRAVAFNYLCNSRIALWSTAKLWSVHSACPDKNGHRFLK